MNLYCKPYNCIARERAGKIVEKKICIAIPFLYCREEGLRVGKCMEIHYIVLQRRNGLLENCIARGWLGQEIVLQE